MNYYDKHANDFIKDTIYCDMSNIYQFFEQYFFNTNTILDVGFGSGRDMLYFKNKGFDVYGIDPSIEMCHNAIKLGLDNIYNTNVIEMNLNKEFDAIWACASLLHIPSNELNEAFINCSKHLKKNGIMYCSFKYGDFEGERNGRYFTDMTLDKLYQYLEATKFEFIDSIITEDVREDKTTKWLNVILKKM